MKKYLTEYKHNGKLYGCEIYAKSKEEAEELLKSKRLTEKIIGHNPTVEYLFDSNILTKEEFENKVALLKSTDCNGNIM